MKFTLTPRILACLAAGLLAGRQASGQSAPVEVPGLLKMEVWNGLSTSDNSLDNTLLADPRYPASPDQVFYSAGFNSRTVFPTDANNGYGARISGVVIPAVSGNYRFFIYSDDSSRLFVSTDDKPANAVLVAEETGCCNVFTEPDSPRTSEPIPLVAGRRYYIEGIWKEGGGGDYMQVAWRLEGDATPAASLTPIPAASVAVSVPAAGEVTIVKQPGDISAARNDYATFLVEVATTNTPVLIQWQRNGVTIPGATGSSLTLGPIPAADNGAKFRALVSTPGAVATSAEATLTVTPDVTLPTVLTVLASSTFDSVTVDFSEAVTAESAGRASNYALDGGVTVSSVTVVSPTRVKLTTSRQAQGAAYVLTLNNIEDTAANRIAADTRVPFSAFGPTKGGLVFEAYLNIPGTAVQSLLDDPRFGTAPDITGFTTSFTSREVFTDSSNENYGGRLFGWIVPDETAQYHFFIRSDDASHLYLSTDDKPENAQLIAEETGCCGAFEDPALDPAPTETSQPQSLVAGRRYFIQAVWKEGGGGDYCDVAWRKVGDNTAPRTLPYIPGTVLEALATPTTFVRPTVAFTAPAEGATFETNAVISLTATATAAAGKSITRVEFLELGRVLATATRSPYTVELRGLAEGPHKLVARAVDSAGLSAETEVRQINVGKQFLEVFFARIDDETLWRYDRSGTDLGTAWREKDFNDSAWPQGKALIADETTTTVEPIRTPISRFNDSGEYVKTFYFRRKFNYNFEVNPLVKVQLRHVVDDGTVVYLNGREIHRFGITADPVDYLSDASGHENAYEGPYEIPASLLVKGENILAVEVHQSGGSSSDMVFGAELKAIIPLVSKQIDAVRIDDQTQWRYDRSGTDLGTAWREPGFNDSAWPLGKALIADETTTTVEPIRTAISRFNDNGDYVKTFYFRTKFTLPIASTTGAKLKLRHVVDDGVLFYLNGTEIHRFGVTADPVDYLSDASGHENAWEGPYDIPIDALRVGENTLAAEVHQSGGSSSDMVFGAEFVAIVLAQQTEGDTAVPAFTKITRETGALLLEYKDGVLQSAPAVTGPYQDVPNAGPQSHRVTTTGGAGAFFQLRSR